MDPIIVEQALPCKPAEAWAALTEPEQMKKWFFEDMPDFKASVGFKTRFDVQAESQVFEHVWEVTHVDEGKSLTVSWKYPNYDGLGMVTYEVESAASGSLVRVICKGIETFPQEIPEFTPESCRGGWEYFLQGRLREYIDQTQS